MKKLTVILFVCFCCSVFGAKAQEVSGALLKDILRTVVDAPSTTVEAPTPRYKMYKTTHDYILLKLDTATGRVWMVQIGMGDKSSRNQFAVDNTTPLGENDIAVNGRFELYPTNNSYNFVMIDTYLGTTYQVQWHTEPNKRFRKFIHE